MRRDEFPIVDKHVQNEINKVLDEIKEEIRNMSSELTRDGRRMIRKMRVLEIIDKHRRE